MLRVTFTIPQKDKEPLTGVVVGATYEEVVDAAKKVLTPHILAQLKGIKYSLTKAWLKRANPLEFARKVVAMYNDQFGEHEPLPQSCDLFVVTWAKLKGFVQIEIIENS